MLVTMFIITAVPLIALPIMIALSPQAIPTYTQPQLLSTYAICPNVVKPASNAAGQYDRLSIYVEAEVGARSDMHEIAVYFKADNNEVAAHLATIFGITTATTQA